MAEIGLSDGQTGGKRNLGEGYDLVMGLSPDEWEKLTAEERAVSALAPFMSLALILKDGDSGETVGCLDTARIIKALVDRAEVIFSIPCQSALATAKEGNHE